MPVWTDIAIKAVTAAVFFFVLQVFVLNASIETGLQWAAVAAIGAACIAWSQAHRS